MLAIEVEGLRKDYGTVRALRGISFAVRPGEIFALLGPNGAGKTTTIRILCGLTRPSGGRVRFFDCDVFREPLRAKRMVGLVPQAINLDLELTVAENLLIHGLLFGLSRREIEARAGTLLRFAGLDDRRGHKVKTLSGGLRRRLLIIRALMHEPRIIFLDEPTVGLDPHIRRRLWGLIKRIQQQGATILLTTHYIEEAEFLASRVAFLDRGEIVVVDTPEALTGRLGRFAVDLVREEGLETRYFSSREEAEGFMVARGRAETMTLRRVNLEDAFVHFTGKRV